jgi:hypothetical protein
VLVLRSLSCSNTSLVKNFFSSEWHESGNVGNSYAMVSFSCKASIDRHDEACHRIVCHALETHKPKMRLKNGCQGLPLLCSLAIFAPISSHVVHASTDTQAHQPSHMPASHRSLSNHNGIFILEEREAVRSPCFAAKFSSASEFRRLVAVWRTRRLSLASVRTRSKENTQSSLAWKIVCASSVPSSSPLKVALLLSRCYLVIKTVMAVRTTSRPSACACSRRYRVFERENAFVYRTRILHLLGWLGS